MRLRALGGLELPDHDFSRTKPLLLLTYLAMEGRQERRRVAELFWPDATDPMGSLRVALYQLGSVQDGIVTADDGWIDTSVTADVEELLDAAARGDVDALLTGYHGPFAGGVELPGLGLELETWLYDTREAVAAKVFAALLTAAEREAAHGRHARAVELAERALRLPGQDEPPPASLARLHAVLLVGSSPRVREVERIAAEYEGIELAKDVAAARASLAHLRRDDGAPDLPNEATSFVGRARELARLERWLEEGPERLVTVTAYGGTGKSRLALRLAHRAAASGRWPAGTAFAPLEDVRAPEAVPEALARAFGLRPEADRDPLDLLAERVGDGRALLVLDNLEHLREAGPTLSRLLERCPRLRLLATSRARLALRTERVAPLAGLPVEADEAGEGADAGADAGSARGEPEACVSDAVRLFLDRARQVRPDLAPDDGDVAAVAELCARLDGHPLSIELAASLARLVPLRELREALAGEPEAATDLAAGAARDLAARHLGPAEVFEHSWNLLDERERAALARLSLFRGGASRQAAARVADAGLVVLGALVDASLVREADGRYHLHPLVAHYARQKLAERDDAPEARDRFAAWAADLWARLAPALWSERGGAALEEAVCERGNLTAYGEELARRGAWDELAAFDPFYLFERGRLYEEGLAALGRLAELAAEAPEPAAQDAAAALRTSRAALESRLGRMREARAAFEAALARPGLPAAVRHRAANRLAEILLYRGRYAEAKGWFEEAGRIAEGVEGLEHQALMARSHVALARGFLGEVGPALEEIEALTRDLEERTEPWVEFVRIVAWGTRVRLLIQRGRATAALGLCEEAISACERLGMENNLVDFHSYAVEARLVAGDGEGAARSAKLAEEIARATGEVTRLATALVARARVAVDQGSPDAARRVREALRAAHRGGFVYLAAEALGEAARLALRARSGDAARWARVLLASEGAPFHTHVTAREVLTALGEDPDTAAAGSRASLEDAVLEAASGW